MYMAYFKKLCLRKSKLDILAEENGLVLNLPGFLPLKSNSFMLMLSYFNCYNINTIKTLDDVSDKEISFLNLWNTSLDIYENMIYINICEESKKDLYVKRVEDIFKTLSVLYEDLRSEFS